ncbi:hypothetical protein CV016_12080 [Yersinia kristensenii]|uniref:Uncharacterized protein n=1 Tax=Yersinia kristensenii TaxID=28152 RepID=A0AB73QB06_YERKR|nr:hypothetical protein CBW52_13125 [Yersinia kristensenii]PJE82825.1 hypothetical protein CU276_15955 [Yersinia kristensenii]PJG62399.1 hypothetical protein CV016_12080 [Yersinia kristensenii]
MLMIIICMKVIFIKTNYIEQAASEQDKKHIKGIDCCGCRARRYIKKLFIIADFIFEHQAESNLPYCINLYFFEK